MLVIPAQMRVINYAQDEESAFIIFWNVLADDPIDDSGEMGDCVFPFTYQGSVYNGCIELNHDRHWCSLTTTYHGQWKNCNDGESFGLLTDN